MADVDTSTRTIAGVAAVVAILALVLTVVDSTRTGLIAQYVGTTKTVAEENDKAILTHIDTANQRIDALKAELAEVKATAEAAAATPAAADEDAGADAAAGDGEGE